MKILVVGAGAVGRFLAAISAAAGHEVTIVIRDTDRPGRRIAIEIDRHGRRQSAEVTVITQPASLPEPPDLLLFAVRQHQLEAALASTAPWSSAIHLTVQNGIGAEQLVTRLRPDAPAIAASLTSSVGGIGTTPSGLVVERYTEGGLGLAPVSNVEPPSKADQQAAILRVARDLAEDLTRAGLDSRSYPDAQALKWSKLLLNLLGNASVALTDLETGTVFRDRRLFRVEHQQLREALDVMRGLGIEPVSLPGGNARMLARVIRLPASLAQPLLVRAVSRGRGGKPPSLQLHLREPRGDSEVAWLNGAVARAATELGIDTPVNAALTRLVIEASRDPDRRAWFRGHPERLITEIDQAGGSDGQDGEPSTAR